MKVMQVGSDENMRQTIKAKDYEQWLELHHLKNAHRTNYLFNSPTGLVHPLYAEVKHVYIDVDENRKRPDRVLNDYFEEKGDIRRAFVSSGRHFHLLLGIDQIPAQHARPTINSFISILSMETGITFDPISSDLLHLRRSVGSINPKNNAMTCYYDPTTFDTSLEPIILGENKLEMTVIPTLPAWQQRVRQKKLRRQRVVGKVDPYDLHMTLPDDMGHFSRIKVMRKLRNAGVSKERALEFTRSWLTPTKYEHMMNEGIVDRIYNYRL